MGIIVETFLSHNGKMRKVKVGYKNTGGALEHDSKNYTYIERAVHKLIVIVPAESANGVGNNISICDLDMSTEIIKCTF